MDGTEFVRQTTLACKGGVLDFCCGMGGLSQAAKELGFQVLAGVDTSPTAIKTFSKNFPGAESLAGSIRSRKVLARCEVVAREFRKSGLPLAVISGPPCQGFSAAGSRDPMDPRNQVLVAVARAIAQLQPNFAVVENVSMLLADKHESRILEFENVLHSSAYNIHTLVLNASDYGVPQKRKRAFFLVSKNPISVAALQGWLEQSKTKSINAKLALSDLPRPRVRPDDYDDEAEYGLPHNHFAMRHSAEVKKKIAAIKPGTGPMSYRRLHPTRLSNTLFSGHRAPPAHFSQSRSITVREAARLQGFPDSFRVFGSFSNQMEQVTNAVPPPLAKIVLSALIRSI